MHFQCRLNRFQKKNGKQFRPVFLDLKEPYNNNEIISVVLGSRDNYSRFQDSKGIIQWTFDNYEW